MIICPACGSTVKADLCVGCPACGARSVGPPLAKAEHALPSFGRAAIAFASGVAMAGVFAAFLIASLIENKAGWFEFWKVVAAGEVAAWRVKLAAMPIAIGVIWTAARFVRSIRLNPSRFNGLQLARVGLVSAITVIVVIATLIAVTVPERLRQRQYAAEAAIKARGYTLHLAMLEYRDLHGTYPTDPDKLVDALHTLPDPDGAIAEALRFIDSNRYEATTQLAAAPKQKPLVARGTALRDASTNAANPEPLAVSFTRYKLPLPAERHWFDSFMGPGDDYVLQNGVIQRASEVASTSSTTAR